MDEQNEVVNDKIKDIYEREIKDVKKSIKIKNIIIAIELVIILILIVVALYIFNLK